MEKKINVIQETRDFGSVCIFALRYSMGRRTYAPSTVIGFIARNFESLDTVDLIVMLKDIEGYDKMHKGDFGDDCDKLDWLRFKTELDTEIKKREKV